MDRKQHKMLTVREVQQRLPVLLTTFRSEGVNAEPVMIGVHHPPEGVVLSYERYLQLLEGRDRVRTILDDRRTAGVGMDEDEAMALALERRPRLGGR